MEKLLVKCLLFADDQVILMPLVYGPQEMVNKMNDSVKKTVFATLKAHAPHRNEIRVGIRRPDYSPAAPRATRRVLHMIYFEGEVQCLNLQYSTFSHASPHRTWPVFSNITRTNEIVAGGLCAAPREKEANISRIVRPTLTRILEKGA
ncbi:hypothetical protein EVAR_52287_1 [Eumeta japonica]|uniref:Reverse transcriptase domain-containing protein n=1 Tax=Eumeta variegata TaxID=151549 RepID=A0A4C1ZMF9_EUMVA|nr:hypothetical protein EVAR_52287_1 [Eumeta japonica]